MKRNHKDNIDAMIDIVGVIGVFFFFACIMIAGVFLLIS